MANRLSRHPPEEFEQMFVRLGRVACETHFRASRRMIDSWLRQIGKSCLIDSRKEIVTRGRQKTRRLPSSQRRMVIVEDSRPASPIIAAAAAHYLRVVRNGGWIVSRTQFGDWRVGMKRLSSHQVIEMAVSKGFQPGEVRK